jgi:hypothetical protein
MAGGARSKKSSFNASTDQEPCMDILKSHIVVGVSAALAVTVLAPVLVPVIVTIGRPIAKSLLKGGLMLYEKGREAVAVAGESVEDMVAEIQAEAAMQGTAGAGAAPAAAGPESGAGAPGASTAGAADLGQRPRPGMAAV